MRVTSGSSSATGAVDVENAARTFCASRGSRRRRRPKAALLPVGPDLRKPMREIYQMFRGDLKPDQVIAAAGSDDLAAVFCAQLYVSLYFEAIGDAKRALPHLTAAAEDRFREAGYMHGVARVHRDLLARGK